MSAVARDAGVGYVVLGNQLIQTLPKFDIFDRFAAAFPSSLFPFWHPFTDAFADIDAVRVQLDSAGTLKSFQASDDRCKLHAVVAGPLLAPPPFSSLAIQRSQRERPTAHAGIAEAAAVGVDDGSV